MGTQCLEEFPFLGRIYHRQLRLRQEHKAPGSTSSLTLDWGGAQAGKASPIQAESFSVGRNMGGDDCPPALPSASHHTCEITCNVSVNITLGHWEMCHASQGPQEGAEDKHRRRCQLSKHGWMWRMGSSPLMSKLRLLGSPKSEQFLKLGPRALGGRLSQPPKKKLKKK